MTAILLLNADYSALGIVPLKRAISLLIKDRIDIIEVVPDKQLRSPSTTQPFPSVIRLRYYVKVPRRKMVWSRRGVFARDQYTCVYCGTKLSREDATVDHLTPVEQCRLKGVRASTWSNTATACPKCNRRKANRSLEDSGMRFKDSSFEAKTPRTNYLIVTSDIRPEWKAYLRT